MKTNILFGRLKQLSHIFLSQPNRFIFKTDINLRVSAFCLINNDLGFIFLFSHLIARDFVMKSSSIVQLNQLNQKNEWLSRKKWGYVDHISGRRILICEPGKLARLVSFSFPRAHAGMMENLAVPERIESLPFHCVK